MGASVPALTQAPSGRKTLPRPKKRAEVRDELDTEREKAFRVYLKTRDLTARAAAREKWQRARALLLEFEKTPFTEFKMPPVERKKGCFDL